MNYFLHGFCDEVCATLCPPMEKRGEMDGTPGLLKKLEAMGMGSLRSPARRLALGSAGIGAFHKMIDPDVSVGRALAGGAALTGGGLAGEAIAKNLRMGGKGRTGLSMVGSILAARALRSRDKGKKKARARARREAREKMIEEHMARSKKR